MSNESLNNKVYTKIKNDIMSLVLEPNAVVSVQKLADAYGASRTPVREAIVRLQQESLVVIYPQAHTKVSAISLDRIREERFVHKSMELAMVDSFIKNCSLLVADTLENINAIMRRMKDRKNIEEFLATDGRFHRLLFETAGQYLACELIESCNAHYNRLRFLSIKHKGFDASDLTEHNAIVEAARQRDSDSMRDTLTKHFSYEKLQTRELEKAYSEYFT